MARVRQMIDKKVIFVGCARNCAAAIPHVLDNISQMSRLFSKTAFIFVENDSVDSTKTDLQAWSQLREGARVISLDGLAAACHIRTIRLETARNRYLSIVRTDYREYDYLFVLDCDDVNAAPMDLEAIRQAINFIDRDENCAGVFSNSAGTYYDLWALRHPLLCPGDVWEEAFDYSTTHRVTDEEAFNQSFLPRIFSIAADSPPFEVESVSV